ncbi:MAG: 50S ribosomal protein L17 [Candidatus Moraniibacteriota bacterium]|nr:MAG: 50S ribosomal protein L17 [Candidatus Moranbacteria bacterium]
MKHRKTGRQFGRVRAQRKALMSSLMSNLIIHGRIETTEAKAKETKSAIDKIITKAKRAKGSKMEMIRKIKNDLSRDAVNIVVESMEKFDARDSGYARVIKLAPRRSDASRMAIVELVDFVGKTDVVEKKTEKKETKVKAESSEDK